VFPTLPPCDLNFDPRNNLMNDDPNEIHVLCFGEADGCTDIFKLLEEVFSSIDTIEI
jgi:hypothetical protein